MRSMPLRRQITVVGAAACDGATAAVARACGESVARAGATLICGGRGGVMAAAAEGAKDAGGLVVGVLPGPDADVSPPNDHLDVVLYSGMLQARNQVLVLSADAVIAIGGGWGTLSEIAFALKFRIPVVLLDSWQLQRPDGLSDPMLFHARTPEDAVLIALEARRKARTATPDPGARD